MPSSLEENYVIQDFHPSVASDIVKSGCALLLTANRAEFDALCDELVPLNGIDYIIRIKINKDECYIGQLGEFPACATRQKDQGSNAENASINTIHSICSVLDILCVVSVGNCFNLHGKLNNKDVVISSSITPYESCVIKEGNYSKVKPIKNASGLLSLFGSINEAFDFDVKVGDILSGEKLIDDLDYKNKLCSLYPDSIAGEREGVGVATACKKTQKGWAIVKAISDNADGNKAATDEIRSDCARNAVRVLKFGFRNLELLKSSFGIQISNDYLPLVTRAEGRAPIPFYNLRGEDVVKLKYPRSSYKQDLLADSTNKIHYEYYLVDEPDDGGMGFLFLGWDIVITKSVRAFIKKCALPSISLIVCSPRVPGGSKDVSYRLTSIRREFERVLKDIPAAPHLNIKYAFLDEYILSLWGKDVQNSIDSLYVAKYFVDQPIRLLQKQSEIVVSKNSCEYLSKKISSTKSSQKPIYALLGEAGVGKSTLCRALVGKISKEKKKRVIYLSNEGGAWPIPKVAIDSIKGLYSYFVNDLKVEEDSIDQDSLELNLCCGNVVLIIDGIDELDSALGDRFDFDLFIESIVDLHKSFNQCKIVLVARDYYQSKIEEIEHVKVHSLHGFEDGTVRTYFKTRFESSVARDLQSEYLNKALSVLHEISDRSPHNPFYADLAAEIVERSGNADADVRQYEGKYLDIHRTIDQLVVKLINRERHKQSISASIDDIFEMLIYVCVDNNGFTGKDDMEGYVKDSLPLTTNGGIGSIESYLVTPFLSFDDMQYSFKYDCLVSFFKSRFLVSQFNNNNFKDGRVYSLLASVAYGKGALLNDLADSHKYLDTNEGIASAVTLYQALCMRSLEPARNGRKEKEFSGFYYFCMALSSAKSKEERTQLLLDICGNVLDHFYIFNEFYPLDLTVLSIEGGRLSNYSNLSKCSFPASGPAISKAHIIFDLEVAGTISRSAFYQCVFNETAERVLSESEEKIANKHAVVRSDVLSVLKTMYNSGRFSLRSRNTVIRKGGNPRGRYSINQLLDLLVKKEVLIKDLNKDLYGIHEEYRHDAIKLIIDSSVSSKLEDLFKSIK